MSVMRISGLVLALTITGRGLPAQGAVTGQVSMLERPGEKTEDLGNVVVFLDPALGYHGKLGPTNAVIAAQSRQFSPRVRVITPGGRVEFPNLDPFSHNAFSKAATDAFDTGLFGRGKTKDAVFPDPGIVPVYCNIHPRMTAFVIVVKSPWFAQAGGDGRFAIDHVPAGKYTMHVWHDRGAEQVSELTVPASGTTGLKVQLDARNYKYVQHKDKFGKDYVFAGDIY